MGLGEFGCCGNKVGRQALITLDGMGSRVQVAAVIPTMSLGNSVAEVWQN